VTGIGRPWFGLLEVQFAERVAGVEWVGTNQLRGPRELLAARGKAASVRSQLMLTSSLDGSNQFHEKSRGSTGSSAKARD